MASDAATETSVRDAHQHLALAIAGLQAEEDWTLIQSNFTRAVSLQPSNATLALKYGEGPLACKLYCVECARLLRPAGGRKVKADVNGVLASLTSRSLLSFHTQPCWNSACLRRPTRGRASAWSKNSFRFDVSFPRLLLLLLRRLRLPPSPPPPPRPILRSSPPLHLWSRCPGPRSACLASRPH